VNNTRRIRKMDVNEVMVIRQMLETGTPDQIEGAIVKLDEWLEVVVNEGYPVVSEEVELNGTYGVDSGDN
jgi:hypothetical protein